MKIYDILFEIKQIIKDGGGEPAGSIEIMKTSVEIAKKYAVNNLPSTKNSDDFTLFLNNFEINYTKAQNYASMGSFERKKMPVVDIDQVKDLQNRLEKGHLDVVDGKTGLIHSSFKFGLTKKQAKQWLTSGLRDGDEFDDIISVSGPVKKKPTDLIPIQSQIYLDKSLDSIFTYGIKDTLSFLSNDSLIIISSDGYIMDGHHRWLSGMLIDPENTEMTVVIIDIGRDKLIDILNIYSDAIGNTRNN